MTEPGPFEPDPRLVTSRDGTSIAVFEVVRADTAEGAGGALESDGSRPPLLLVHGATADHTTWRTVGPVFARSRRVFAVDRRGRGDSGDGATYAIEREFEDVAAVTEALGGEATGQEVPDGSVDVAGHSFGGRCGLGASLRTNAIRRLVVYEGAPVPPGLTYRPAGLVEAVRGALDAGDDERALMAFLAGIVGMSDAALEAYRRDPVWPARVRAAHTILREVEAEATPPASLDALASVTVPVLLLLGSISRSPFRIGTDALAAQLANARIAVIDGAAHAGHHTHAAAFVDLVERFLDDPEPAGQRS